MVDRIHIPATIAEAVASLDGLGRLLTAKQWERAAIVYAFTHPGVGGRNARRNLPVSGQVSIASFADLGIVGLRKRDQVALYRRAWEQAMQDGAPDVKPGDDIELPSLPWKDAFGEPTRDVQERVARSFIANNPDALSRIIREEPESARAIARQVIETPALNVAVEAAKVAREERQAIEPAAHRPPVDYSDDLRHAVNGLVRVLSAMRDGRWAPDPIETTLLAFLRQAFAEITDEPESSTSYNVIDEIEAFLVNQR